MNDEKETKREREGEFKGEMLVVVRPWMQKEEERQDGRDERSEVTVPVSS